MFNNKTILSIVVGFLAICTCVSSIAQNRVTLTLDDADVMDLVRWAQDVTPKTIIVHPSVKGKVTVVAGDPMTRGEAYQLFLSVLEVNGFGVVDTPQSIKILPNPQAKQFAIPITSEEDSNLPEELIVRVIKISNVAAAEVVNIIRPLVPQDAYLVAYPSTNSIIVADRLAKINEIIKLIDKIDRVGVVDIDLIPLDFARAKDVVTIINSLLPSKQANEMQAVKLAVDERSNSILVSGDPASKQQIQKLIVRLDKPLPGDGNTQVIYLNYIDANELVPILQGISGNAKKNEKDQSLSNTEVSIQASAEHNALIISAPTSILNSMKGVIHELDVRRAQVLVEALIVEVNEDLNKNFGVDWSVPGNLEREMVVGGFSSFPSNLSPLGINEDGSISLSSGFSLGYLKGGDLRAVISALRGEANANILSTPTILALDNEEAHILVGENVPFVTGSEKREGDTNPFQTIERQDIGVSLIVTPRINTDNSVTLSIDQKVESIGQTDVETADIITNKREIKTRVLVGSGEILVLGGLVRDEVVESESRVPFLGSIPLLGRAFRSTSASTVKRNLMVFIKPQILIDESSGTAASYEKYNYMRSKQLDFGRKIDRNFTGRKQPLLEELDNNASQKQ